MKRGDSVRLKGNDTKGRPFKRTYIVRATRRNARGVQIQLRGPKGSSAREDWRNGEDFEVVTSGNPALVRQDSRS